MGNFRIIINAVGGHGDKRSLKDGEKNYGCLSMTCPDCLAREFVETLRRRGNTLESATLEHWPAMDLNRALCTFSGAVTRSAEGPTQIGEHGAQCGTASGGPIVDDLITGIRHGSFGNS
jgi:hypothetical protein